MKKGIAIKFYSIEHFFWEKKLYCLAKLIYHSMKILLGCTIPPQVILEEGCDIPHSHGIVFFHDVVIGKNSKIFQNVTLGGLPNACGIRIGENCIIGAGAVVLGHVTIGNNCKIGANAVVLMDVPDNCTVVGVPGRIINK